MHTSYEIIKTKPRLLMGLTGLSVAEFESILAVFIDQIAIHRQGWRNAIPASERQRVAGGGKQYIMNSDANKLLFIISYLRVYPTFLFQGFMYGHSEGSACEWVGKLLPVLDDTLGKKHLKPARLRGRNLEEILRDFPELEELGLLADGTERPIRRPKDPSKQERNFSGKKKRHTTKIITYVNPKSQRVVGVSDESPGSAHDKRIMDEQDIVIKRRGRKFRILADRGFIGAKLPGIKIITPKKVKRHKKGEPKNKLTKKQKEYNKNQASLRIAIEHSNSGFKRSRAASDVLRSIKDGRGELFTTLAISLHNLRVESRTSYSKPVLTS